MEKWLKENPQGKKGRNTYNLADFGITEEMIQERFADYRNKYNI